MFQGEWVQHPQYGRQFKAASCEVLAPSTLLGIERYLASGLIRGVGAATARLIVQEFGLETMVSSASSRTASARCRASA